MESDARQTGKVQNLEKRRKVILVACAITGAILGAVYTWSVFSPGLVEEREWSVSDVSLAYSLFIVMVFIAGLVAGWIQTRVNPRIVMTIAAVSFSIAWFGASVAQNIPQLYVLFSVLGGLGNGILYNTAISLVAQWYPDKKGFASGVCVGAMGLGPVVFAPLANALLETYGVVFALRVICVVFVVVLLVFAPMITRPPQNWKPSGWKSDKATSAQGAVDMNVADMARDIRFYILWVVFACASAAGMMLLGHASSVGRDIAGMTAAQGSIAVSFLCAGKCAGCLTWGMISDRIGRFRSMLIILLSTAVLMSFILGMATDVTSCLIAFFAAGFFFGGALTVMPTLCAETFGMRHYATNYAVFYSAFALASIVGPMVAAQVVSVTGSYAQAFPIAGVLAAVGTLFLLMAWRIALKRTSGRIVRNAARRYRRNKRNQTETV